MSLQKSNHKFAQILFYFVVTVLISVNLSYAQSQEVQQLQWLAKAESQFSSDAWQKIPATLRLLIGAPQDFLKMKANTMEVLKIETSEPEVGVLVKSIGDREQLEALGAKVGSQIGDIFTVRIALSQLGKIAELPEVISIAPSMKLQPSLDLSLVDTRANLVHQGNYSTTPPTYSGFTGKDVLVLDIDTGIDWKHGDFINDSDGTSRILYIWDQTLTPSSNENNPPGFSYGVEYSQAAINDEIDGSPTGYVRTKDVEGHGTHVMGIIAGDGSSIGGGLPAYTYVGMAPLSDILIVKTGFSFTQILDGIFYAMNKSDEIGKPVVINLSLETQAGPHDGSTLFEQAINSAVNTGKVTVVVSAGNYGSDAAHGEYIHAEGTVTTGSTHTTTFVVPSYTANSGGGNDAVLIDFWYQGGDNINVKITTPNGYTWNAGTGSDNNGSARSTSDGAIYIDNSSGGEDPNNGDRECYIQIWDYYSNYPPKTGTWTITVTGNSIAEGGVYDAWIYASQVGSNLVYFSASSGSNKELIGCPGTAEQVITIACHSTKTSWLSYNGSTYNVPDAVLNDLAYFSSPGPTRDGKQKPDLSAPGFGVISARSSDASWTVTSELQNIDGVHLMMWGTSMSAPQVAGTVALLLDKNPFLNPQEIKQILTTSARSDVYTGSVPNYQWGYGKLDANNAAQQIQQPQLAVNLFPPTQTEFGLADSTVKYMVNVKNLGTTDDSYNLIVSGNLWQTTIWNAAGTSQITNTDLLSANSEIAILIKVQVPAGMSPSSRDVATLMAVSATNSMVQDQAAFKTCTPADLPWSDNFPATTLDTIKWMVNIGPTEITNLGRNEPSSPYSLNLNGDKIGRDEVQSQAINLAGKSYIKLIYYYQRTGFGDSPETDDDLWVDYYNSAGEWVNLRRYYGSGSDMTSYTKAEIDLPADAYHYRFRIRFRNVGSMGAFDDWFIDDVALIPPATLPWSDNFPTTTLDATKWPYNSGPAVVNSVGINEPSAPYSLNLNSTDQVQSQLINLAGQTNVSLSYYYEKKGDGDSPEAGKDLFVDYANPAGNWINLKQHLGSSPDMTNYDLVQVNLPADAYYGGFRIRFRTTGSYNADDWFVDDVLIKPLAEPDITVSPDSFEVTLYPGDSTLKTMTLGNMGSGDLTFTISIPPPGVNWLSFSPGSATITPGGSQSINIKFRSAGLTPGSSYHTKLIISSNDPDESSLDVPVHLTVALVPIHFIFRDSTSVSYSIVIDKATIDENLLQVNDEIGVFTPAGLCVGASIWTGTMPLALTAWKDDGQTPAVDGYKDGEKMYFRIWDESVATELSATPTYSTGNGNFGDGAYARISILKATPIGQLMIYIQDTLGTAGGMMNIPVLVTDVTGKGILSFAMTVQADTSVLIPLDAFNSGTIAAGWQAPTYSKQNGQINIAMTGVTPLSGSGVLIFIKFLVNSKASNGDNTVMHLLKMMFNEGEPTATTRDGVFTVISGTKISGKINYYPNELPVKNVVVSLKGSSSYEVTSNMNGQYEFKSVLPGNYTSRPKKKNDLDAAISPYDASLILQYTVNSYNFSPYQMIAADVSGNGQVTAFDASFILRYFVGLIKSFPAMPDSTHFWTFVPKNYSISGTNWSIAPDSLRYEPLNADKQDQNFVGIIYGDPSGNWSPSGMLASSGKVANKPVTFSFGEALWLQDKRLSIPIEVNEGSGLISAGLVLEYDSDILKVIDISTGEMTTGYSMAYKIDGRQVRIALAGTEPLNKKGTIATLTCEILDPSKNLTNPIALTEVIVNENEIAATFQNSEINLESAIPEEFMLYQNYPNPFNPETTIKYQLPERGKVVLRVFNLSGQEIRTLVDELKEAGCYNVLWDGRDSYGRKMTSGIYVYQIKVNNFLQSKKMAILK